MQLGRKIPTKADLGDPMRDISPEPQPVEPPTELGLPESPGTRLTPAAGGFEASTVQLPTKTITGKRSRAHIEASDLESVAARAASVAAREAVRAPTAARPSVSPASGGQTHNTAEATAGQAENVLEAGDLTRSAASSARVTGVGSVSRPTQG